MRLVHFSSRKRLNPILSVEQGTTLVMGKPAGFWVSDESEEGWSKWCISEGFRLKSLTYEHSVDLADDAKILYLRNHKDIDDFAKKYMNKGGIYEKLIKDRSFKYKPPILEIHWEEVAKKYDGIIITPYIWTQRLGKHMWYYGWDCASGCIWDARAIKSIKLTQTNELYRKVKEKTARQQRAELRKMMKSLGGKS